MDWTAICHMAPYFTFEHNFFLFQIIRSEKKTDDNKQTTVTVFSALTAGFSESALPGQSVLGLGRLGRETDLHVTSIKVNFETNFQKSQTTNLY